MWWIWKGLGPACPPQAQDQPSHKGVMTVLSLSFPGRAQGLLSNGMVSEKHL